MNYEPLLFVLTILAFILYFSIIFGWKNATIGSLIAIIAYTIVWTYCALLVVYFA